MPFNVARAHGETMVTLIDCLWKHQKQDLPAVILAYATIDAFALLTAAGKRGFLTASCTAVQ